MFLDDSFELDLTDHIDNAEAMPLTSEFNLKDIYIPKNLLPNRERLKDPNEKRPYSFHTLDFFDVENRFSVYSEENRLEYHETEISENILPSSTSQTLVDDNIFKFISNASPQKTNIIDSLEELHISNVESSEKNPELLKTNISGLSCSVQNEDINNKMFNMSSEKIQDSKLADNKMCETQFADSIQSIINTDSDSKQEIFHKDELSDNDVEKVIELPIPYRRPELEQNNVKVRSQKGKKKASKTKKNMSLQKFFLVDTPVDSTAVDDFHNRFEVPENDKFYENLISKHEYREYSYEDSTNICKLPASYQVNFLENRLIFNEEQKGWAGKTSFSEVVNTNVSVNAIDETKTIEPKKKENNSSKILIIDKIPLSVSEKDIENIILGFGTIIKILITRHGMFLRAKLEMDFICDIDWVIECLNNSQPFVYGEQPIKCYQQS
ncbi:uncharacterized protein CDAR_94191 [Caerostris darwini]|uniref:RRM domain-containing protein n=1 Tax=Caerostris darwini TaxID=1538125 RepID=A0AAV4VNT5_9ARAC|nr:uncharacterized protein CDAR_94191 [Caerostris darwini]